MLRAIRTQIKWEFVDDFEDLMITCSIEQHTVLTTDMSMRSFSRKQIIVCM